MEGRKDLGVQTKRLLKRITKNKIKKKNRISSINLRNIIPNIGDYLKSDCYLYSHLISSSKPFDDLAPFDGLLSSRDTGEPVLVNKEQMKEKLEVYLKSDTYLYTPLEGIRHCDDNNNIAVKSVISSPRAGQELQFTSVSSTILSENIAWQTKEVAEKYVVEKRRDHGSNGTPEDASILFPKTPALQEVKKQARRSSRLSTISG